MPRPKAESCIYPIDEKTVILLGKPRKLYNKHIGAVCEHAVYIWIQRFEALPKSRQPKKRPVRIGLALIPTAADMKMKYLYEEKTVQKHTIAKWCKNEGCEAVATNITFNYQKPSYVRFYTAIGLVE